MRNRIILGVVVLIAVIGASLWFSGVLSPDTIEPTPEDIRRAASLRPQAPDIAAIYDRACVACHSVVDAKAPLTGHAAAWRARLNERGLDGLLASIHNGFGNMPPMGLCLNCTDEDFTRLIAFMSATEN